MTSPSAQKAAGEIKRYFVLWALNIKTVLPLPTTFDEINASIIQQAITEAVDAAVASQKARYDALARKWQQSGNETCAVILQGPVGATFDKCAQELLAEGEK